MNNFIKTYITLFKNNIKTHEVYKIFLLESLGSILNVAALFMLAFIIQSITSTTLTEHKFFQSVPIELSKTSIVGIAIIANISLMALSGFICFQSAKLCRKTTRQAYLASLRINIDNFSNSQPDTLHLTETELTHFQGLFTTDAHQSFMALEAMLRIVRPISLLVILLIPILIIEPKTFYLFAIIILSIFPFLKKANINTAKSAQSVFGEQRKQVYRSIVEEIKSQDEIDKTSELPNQSNYLSFDITQMNKMLDSFDDWKLSTDKVNYILTIVKSIGLQLAIVIFISILYFYENKPLYIIAALAMGILKIQEAFLGLFARLTVLSRLYPIVKRYVNTTKKLARSNQQNSQHAKTDYRNNLLLKSNKSILVLSPKLKKSEIPFLNEQLQGYNVEYDIQSIAETQSGFITQENKNIDHLTLFNKYIESENHQDPLFTQLLEKCGYQITPNTLNLSKHSQTTTKLNDIQTLFLVILSHTFDEEVQHIVCTPGKIVAVQRIIKEHFTHFTKPIIVFSRSMNKKNQDLFDIVLDPPSTSATQSNLDDLIDII